MKCVNQKRVPENDRTNRASEADCMNYTIHMAHLESERERERARGWLCEYIGIACSRYQARQYLTAERPENVHLGGDEDTERMSSLVEHFLFQSLALHYA